MDAEKIYDRCFLEAQQDFTKYRDREKTLKLIKSFGYDEYIEQMLIDDIFGG